MVTDPESQTNVDEIADDIYRINTPVALANGAAFSFNQYLVVDDEPVLVHTGPRRLFSAVHDAITKVMPLARLRYVAVSHVEADECGSLNQLLMAAPGALPVCGSVAAQVSMRDLADRPPRALADGEILPIGRSGLLWLDAPHLPHAWECGYLFEPRTRTLLCGDLFTQPGAGNPPVSQADILGPSESFRKKIDYFSHTKYAGRWLAHLAQTAPETLACMHGSAWRGDGAALLLALAAAFEA